MVCRGMWKVGWTPDMLLGASVHGATLGIIGLGRIGSAVARRAKGFDMKIIYHNRRRNEEAEAVLGARHVSLDKLLAKSDFVSIHASLNEASRHLVNSTSLSKMKNTAFLINTARGAIVDERALASALRKAWIAGAGLDVFEKEPLPAKSPLAKMKNVVLLPHIGSAARGTRIRMAEVAVKSVLDVLSGEKPDPAFWVNR